MRWYIFLYWLLLIFFFWFSLVNYKSSLLMSSNYVFIWIMKMIIIIVQPLGSSRFFFHHLNHFLHFLELRMTYSFLNCYRNTCEFIFNVILICIVGKTNFKVCVCARMCVHEYMHVVMCVLAYVWNNQVISLEYTDTEELSY